MKKLFFTLLSSLLLSTALFGVNLNPSTTNNSLIIYNSNIGLVHESRKLNLLKTDSQIIYEDVASSINTDSVNVTLPNGVKLFSQQYRYDKLTQQKLLDAHIGKNVTVKIMKNSTEFQFIEAQLLSSNLNTSIIKHKNKIITVESNNVIFKTIPSSLITKPSLVWNVKSQKNINAKISLDYLIGQITWKSNYILNLHDDEAHLSGWININNRSGKSFQNTNLHVLAGEINRAYQAPRNYRVLKSAMVQDGVAETRHQAHEGYHFYSIPFKVSLANNEKTQVKFISQNNISITRKYLANMSNPNYLHGEHKKDVSQLISFEGLDYPLPKGIVRTYSKLQNTSILLGETSLKHTPKNTPISLRLGKNFDIKVTETLQKRDKSTWYIDEDVKYSIKNSSDEDKKIELQIPFNSNDDSTVKSDKKYTFTKGNIVSFKINVKANSTKRFTVYYRIKKP